MMALRRGLVHLASGAVVGRVFGFLGNLLLSRWLGPYDLGLFNLVSATVQTSDTLVRCGGDYALNYELGGQPEAIQTQRGVQLARGLAQICSLTTALICAAVAFWLWLGHGLFPVSLEASKRLLLSSLLLLMVACEGISVAAWEILLVSHRTRSLALRQGLFLPLRLTSAAAGSLFAGVFGAMSGWCIVALIQCVWLRIALGNLWKPFKLFPLLWGRILQLLRFGLPFYVANLTASIIFYPLLVNVATGSGIVEIGYLRVGQILQQMFTFLPATLVPILFLKLRGEKSFGAQVVLMETPLRLIWFVLLEILLLYCVVDRFLIGFLFGAGFVVALQPTRLLLLTTLFECLTQLLVQPLLAAGRTRFYGYWQNGAAALAAILGWICVPLAGLKAYLTIRLLYAIVPFLGFSIPVTIQLINPRRMLSLAAVSIGIVGIVLYETYNSGLSCWVEPLFLLGSIVLIAIQRQDVVLLRKLIARKS